MEPRSSGSHDSLSTPLQGDHWRTSFCHAVIKRTLVDITDVLSGVVLMHRLKNMKTFVLTWVRRDGLRPPDVVAFTWTQII